MSVKPIPFKPTLATAQGINNYSGSVFRCFTAGDTLPFQFTFKDADTGAVVESTTGWAVTVVFSDKQNTAYATPDNGSTTFETDIPEISTGVFEGFVPPETTEQLPHGLIYAMAQYELPTGEIYIIDMALIEVYPNVIYNTVV